jgi:hypothetical protein
MTLERGRPRDESMKGGNQSTDMSMIHRRCTARVVSPNRFGKRRRTQHNELDKQCDHMSSLSDLADGLSLNLSSKRGCRRYAIWAWDT